MVKKIISFLLLLIVGFTLFSGCSSTTDDNTQIKNLQVEPNKNNNSEEIPEENDNITESDARNVIQSLNLD
jgi:uncharacterized protein YcfL